MSLWAVGMVRDEPDVIEATIAHLESEGCAGIIVADNMSERPTVEALERARAAASIPVLVVPDDEPGYYQSEKITDLADTAARELGASWILPFDADEVWSHPKKRIVDALEQAEESGVHLVCGWWYDHFVTALDEGEHPFERMVWRGPKRRLVKVCYRWRAGAVVAQGAHSVEMPGYVKRCSEFLVVDHFPYRSFEQFARKVLNGVAAYAAAPDLPEKFGSHWREYGEVLASSGLDGLWEVWETCLTHEDPMAEGLTRDPAPLKRWATPMP